MTKLKCIINPKTKKPYTRHKYGIKNLGVTSYSGSFSHGMRPASYSYEVICERCGFHAGVMNY